MVGSIYVGDHLTLLQSKQSHFSWPSLTEGLASTSCTYLLIVTDTTLVESAEGGE